MADGKWHDFPKINAYSYRYIYPRAYENPKIVIKEKKKEDGFNIIIKEIDCKDATYALTQTININKAGKQSESTNIKNLEWNEIKPDSDDELALVLACNRLP